MAAPLVYTQEVKVRVLDDPPSSTMGRAKAPHAWPGPIYRVQNGQQRSCQEACWAGPQRESGPWLFQPECRPTSGANVGRSVNGQHVRLWPCKWGFKSPRSPPWEYGVMAAQKPPK